jgi:hypothetical protein
MKCLKCKSDCFNEKVSYGGRLEYDCFMCGEQYRLVDGRLFPYKRQPSEQEILGRFGTKNRKEILYGT